jgi:hypothetical protein
LIKISIFGWNLLLKTLSVLEFLLSKELIFSADPAIYYSLVLQLPSALMAASFSI